MPWSAATAATAKCKRQFIGFARRRISTTVSPWTCSAIPKRRTELKLLKPSTTSERAKKVPLMMLKTQKIQMAYEITAYPLLDLAEARFASDPKRDPTEHGPSSYEMAINELIRDAQEYPDKG